MGSPFLILGFGVQGGALIQTRKLNHYTRRYKWVIPASLGVCLSVPREAILHRHFERRRSTGFGREIGH